jgi:hypothetical protein
MNEYEYRRRAYRSMAGPHWLETLMLAAISVTMFVWFLALLPVFAVLHLVEVVCVKAEPVIEDVQQPMSAPAPAADALSDHQLHV